VSQDLIDKEEREEQEELKEDHDVMRGVWLKAGGDTDEACGSEIII
jgi:hypothetical protein